MKGFYKNIEIELPQDVRTIMELFDSNGFEIYCVGGCVRDSILNRSINDWDLCTNATPEDMQRLCNDNKLKYIPTGLKHGTITIVLNNENYEVTTYRVEGDYSDGRHPDTVAFTSSLKEDLARRDFTINALAYNYNIGLADYFNGTEDLKAKIVKCVGEPRERFNEDNLRRLRALRFSCQLSFDIERDTYEQLKENVEKITLLSIERIREELNKILMSNNAGLGIRELSKLGMLRFIIPELMECVDFNQFNKHHDKDVFEHILSVVDNIEPRLELRLAALFHDIGKPNTFEIDEKGEGHFIGHDAESAEITEKVLKRLKYDNRTINTVTTLVRYHMNRYEKIKDSSVKKFINRVGLENIEDLFKLQIADIEGSANRYQNYHYVTELREKCLKIISERQPLSIKDLNVSGKDLIDIGFKPGVEMGKVLNYLLELVLERPELNNKEDLVNIIVRDLSKSKDQ